MNDNFFEEAKSRLTIQALWKILGLPENGNAKWIAQGREEVVVNSPFRDESSPSFSIFGKGTKFRDHGSGDHGDIFDFYMLARNCTRDEAIRGIGEILGIKVKRHDHLFSSKRIIRPSISNTPPMKTEFTMTDVYEIQKQLSTDLAALESNEDLLKFLKRKLIKPEIFCKMLLEHSASFEEGRIHYHYRSGIKVRWDWESSKSTRWKSGGSAETVWRELELTRSDIFNVVITEGETDCMRLLSYNLSDETAVVAMPSAGWSPDPVMCGLIANSRSVLIMGDNDAAGLASGKRISSLLKAHSMFSKINVLEWEGFEVNDLCELDDEGLSKLLDINHFIL